MKTWAKRWEGATAVCLASGPSLTEEDVALVQAWRNEPGWKGKRYVIVCNSTFLSVPWADVLVAHDPAWWDTYHKAFRATFKGVGVTWTPMPALEGVDRLDRRDVDPKRNTGVGAIGFAVFAGCTKVILLGYDGGPNAQGQAHHHPDHPAPLTNCRSYRAWPSRFLAVAQYASLKRARVYNCSRETRLDCFPRARLEETLCLFPKSIAG